MTGRGMLNRVDWDRVIERVDPICWLDGSQILVGFDESMADDDIKFRLIAESLHIAFAKDNGEGVGEKNGYSFISLKLRCEGSIVLLVPPQNIVAEGIKWASVYHIGEHVIEKMVEVRRPS